jgi:hypothetical protein
MIATGLLPNILNPLCFYYISAKATKHIPNVVTPMKKIILQIIIGLAIFSCATIKL